MTSVHIPHDQTFSTLIGRPASSRKSPDGGSFRTPSLPASRSASAVWPQTDDGCGGGEASRIKRAAVEPSAQHRGCTWMLRRIGGKHRRGFFGPEEARVGKETPAACLDLERWVRANVAQPVRAGSESRNDEELIAPAPDYLKDGVVHGV
jgi:hypothetical protein